MLLVDGQVLVDPPNEQLAQALGARTRPAARRYDVAVVGAWTGRAGRGDLCRLRRACHTAVGTGGDRRPGGHDLPDPQLPGLPTRGERRGAGRAGRRAGGGLRRRTRLRPARDPVRLARHAEQVTLVHRGGSLTSGMSAYLVGELERAGNVIVRLHTEVAGVHGTGRLEALTLRDNTSGTTTTLPAAALFILIGAEPHTDWLAATLERDVRGFIRTGRDVLRDSDGTGDWPLDRPPLLLETSLPGVFAAGDVRHGSVKRVAAAVGEGASAIQLVHQYLGEASPAIH